MRYRLLIHDAVDSTLSEAPRSCFGNDLRFVRVLEDVARGFLAAPK
jgi:hypothetical protein